MKLTDFLEGVSARHVQYYPDLVPILGSVNATILFGQLLYWRGKESSKDGWLFKSQTEIQIETALSREEQETARKKLRETGVLLEKKRGIPCRLWYWLDLDKVNELWQIKYENQENGQIPQAGSRGKRKQEHVKYAVSTAETRQPTSDTTTDITKNNTTNTKTSGSHIPMIPESIMNMLPKSKRTHTHLAVLHKALDSAGEKKTEDNIRRAIKAATSNDPWGLVMTMLRALAQGDDWYQESRKNEAIKAEKQASALQKRQEDAEEKEKKNRQELYRQAQLLELYESLHDDTKLKIRDEVAAHCARIGIPESAEIFQGAMINVLKQLYPESEVVQGM